jgi:hypothetical protein
MTYTVSVNDTNSRSFIGDSGSGGQTGLVPAPVAGDATKYLKGDGTWAIGGAGSGDIATDVLWDAAGDLAVGTGANTAAKLSKGTALQVLRVNAGATALEWSTAGSGDALVANPLSQFAATTSAQLAGVLSDETGTGVVVYNSGATQTGGTHTGLTGLGIRSTGTGAFDLTIANSENLTAGRTLTIDLGDTARTLTIGAAASVSGTNTGDNTVATALTGSPTIEVTAINLGHASDTTLARVSAGVVSVEGVTIPSISSTNTLTNKRVTARTSTEASSATPTINTDNVDIHTITALAVDITSMTTNLTGTPVAGDSLIIQITGTAARAITWGASFESSTVTLPSTTVTTAMLTVGFLWNTATSKWRCVASV